MIDWADPKRTDVIHFVMVDPNNLDETFGEIEDVQLGSSTLTYGYYTDTRYSSQVTFLRGNNYVKNAWIRIIHEVPAAGYVKELGTFVPTSPNVQYGGAVTVTYDLQSPLWALANDLITSKLSFGNGSGFAGAFGVVCNRCGRPYLLQNPNNYATPKTIVYEAGTSYLDILFDLSSSANNRVDVDGHGRLILEPNIDRRYLSPSWELNVDDPRSLIIEGSVRMEPQSDEIPNRIIVVNDSYVGVADIPAGEEYSAAQRGYVKAQMYNGTGVNSNAAAQSLAQAYLNGFSKITQWTMDTMYFPAKVGENVYFTIEGVKHLCMIQSIDPVNLDTMTMKLTLREVANG
jgi:hypothetical protein